MASTSMRGVVDVGAGNGRSGDSVTATESDEARLRITTHKPAETQTGTLAPSQVIQLPSPPHSPRTKWSVPNDPARLQQLASLRSSSLSARFDGSPRHAAQADVSYALRHGLPPRSSLHTARPASWEQPLRDPNLPLHRLKIVERPDLLVENAAHASKVDNRAQRHAERALQRLAEFREECLDRTHRRKRERIQLEEKTELRPKSHVDPVQHTSNGQSIASSSASPSPSPSKPHIPQLRLPLPSDSAQSSSTSPPTIDAPQFHAHPPPPPSYPPWDDAFHLGRGLAQYPYQGPEHLCQQAVQAIDGRVQQERAELERERQAQALKRQSITDSSRRKMVRNQQSEHFLNDAFANRCRAPRNVDQQLVYLSSPRCSPRPAQARPVSEESYRIGHPLRPTSTSTIHHRGWTHLRSRTRFGLPTEYLRKATKQQAIEALRLRLIEKAELEKSDERVYGKDVAKAVARRAASRKASRSTSRAATSGSTRSPSRSPSASPSRSGTASRGSYGHASIGRSLCPSPNHSEPLSSHTISRPISGVHQHADVHVDSGHTEAGDSSEAEGEDEDTTHMSSTAATLSTSQPSAAPTIVASSSARGRARPSPPAAVHPSSLSARTDHHPPLSPRSSARLGRLYMPQTVHTPISPRLLQLSKPFPRYLWGPPKVTHEHRDYAGLIRRGATSKSDEQEESKEEEENQSSPHQHVPHPMHQPSTSHRYVHPSAPLPFDSNIIFAPNDGLASKSRPISALSSRPSTGRTRILRPNSGRGNNNDSGLPSQPSTSADSNGISTPPSLSVPTTDFGSTSLPSATTGSNTARCSRPAGKQMSDNPPPMGSQTARVSGRSGKYARKAPGDIGPLPIYHRPNRYEPFIAPIDMDA